MRLRPYRPPPEQRRAAATLAAWTRERFALAPDAPVSVRQLAGGVPGGPLFETVVVFGSGVGERHCQFRVFKRLADVLPSDLPYAWQKNSLPQPGDEGCDCC